MSRQWWGTGVVLAVGIAAAPVAMAQETARIDAIEAQMRQLQQELVRLRREAEARQSETRAARAEAQASRNEAQAARREAQRSAAAVAAAPAAPAAPAPAAAPASGGLTFPGGRPTFTSADGRFSAFVGARMHFDVGGYIRDERSTPNNRGIPNLDSFGQNLRRGRIYLGFRYNDFTFNITPEFGGSADGSPSLYEANANWNATRNITASIGYLKPLLTLADATSSNDHLFFERPAISTIATGISAGSGRAGAGVRYADDRIYASAYLTGNAYGANSATQGTPSQTGGVARITGRPYRDENIDVHLGISGSYAFDIRRTTANNAFGSNPVQTQTLTLNDRPGELRIDNAARLINTGAINADTASVFSPEFAMRFRNFFLQGEYTQIGVDQAQARGVLRPGLTFNGGYVEASWVMTGETRRYNPTSGAFVRPSPRQPFSLRDGTWGAWELSARYSVADLNSNVTRGRTQASTGGVYGGRQEAYGLGLSWYPNNNLRFLLGWNIVNVDRLDASGRTQIGQRFHTLALRTQLTF